MSKRVVKVHVKKVLGYLYYVDKQGDVSRAKMTRGGKKGGKPKKVLKVGLKKKSGFLYFIDKKGDISSARMAGGPRYSGTGTDSGGPRRTKE